MRKLSLLILLLLITGHAIGQDITVRGNVVNKNTQNPAADIIVTVRKSRAETITDVSGAFTINARVGQTLKISSRGYKTITVKVSNASPILIELETELSSSEEMVVTGYGLQRRADLTGAVAVVDVSPSKDVPNANLMQTLQGKIAGMNITTSGSPNGRTEVNIRGINTLNDNPVLYIIDGLPTTDPNILSGMDQNSIASFQVLKDAASASIYGSRASGGVVIITTKSGKEAVKGK